MDFLLVSFLGKPVWLWLLFLALVVVLLVLDLGVLNRGNREIGVRLQGPRCDTATGESLRKP